MKKKIFIGLGIFVLLVAIAGFYLNYRNRTLSPSGDAKLAANGLTISVTYSRPSVRGRLVFGTEEEKALQPYGKYWRLGANEATEITFDKDVVFNDQNVKAGTYRMFAFPGPETFEIALNSELGKWGYSDPDYSKDVARTKVPVEKTQSPVEQYTISLKESNGGIDVIFEWSDTRFAVPVKGQ
jgi:hypothetical protein